MALIEKLENIGNAIRTKTGKTDLLTLDEMVTEIGNIETGGSGDVSEYFNTEVTTNTTGAQGILDRVVKKLPNLIIGSNVTSMASAFAYYQGDVIPNITFLSNKVTNFSSCFVNCSNITTIPQIDTSNGTNFSVMFSGCSKLTEVPLINTSKGTTFNSMFTGCVSLETIPQIDTSNGTNFASMFYFTSSSKLKTIPKLNMSKATNISSLIYSSSGGNQSHLAELENLGGFENLGEAYSTTSNANYSYYTLDILSNARSEACNKITHESLMNVINNLYDIGAKGCNTQKLQLGSLNLSKLTADEIAIATNKGWTVS